jgi:hypothetical protein
MLALFLVVASASPPPLSCLARWYAGTPQESTFTLPDGTVLPLDDGRNKTPAERVEAPDLEDQFHPAYPRGPAAPITDPAHDPGRARVDALFIATYGTHPPLRRVKLGGGSVQVHVKVAPALERVVARLEPLARADPKVAAAIARPAGGFLARNIAGTARTSPHSWGIAVDLDTRTSDYWKWSKGPHRWRNRIPQSIIEAFESEGFIWGGRWYHYDTMHFEYRPELLDPSCWR